jgi:predicted GTPase
MFTSPLEFSSSEEITPLICFHEKLNSHSRLIHEKALARAQRYLVAEADLLESIIEVDRDRTYEKWGLTHLTPYCVKHLGLSEEVAATFVRVARKSLQVPELKEAISEGKLSVTKAKTIAAVLTAENQQVCLTMSSPSCSGSLNK